MIQFNLCRFGKLAKWSLQGDKRYYVKTFLQFLVVLLLIFVFFTMIAKMGGGPSMGYRSCAIAEFAVVIVNIALGPALMFYSMEGKHDMQTLMMLPASNFEKYLVRYSNWIILVALSIVACLAADVLQYLIHLLFGHNYGRFVTSVLWGFFGEFADNTHTSEATRPRFIVSMITLVIWFQSLYAVGATLFRSRKFNWVITTMVIILIGMVFVKYFRNVEAIQLNDHSTVLDFVLGLGFYLVWAMINFWLSYRFFCRTQVIGKIVNI
jgi:hypothetical protein